MRDERVGPQKKERRSFFPLLLLLHWENRAEPFPPTMTNSFSPLSQNCSHESVEETLWYEYQFRKA
jgi:hypothetical protein